MWKVYSMHKGMRRAIRRSSRGGVKPGTAGTFPTSWRNGCVPVSGRVGKSGNAPFGIREFSISLFIIELDASRFLFHPDALPFHGASDDHARIGADKLNLIAAIDNHQVAVNRAVWACIHRQTSGAIRVHRVGSGECDGRYETAEVGGRRAGETAVTVEMEIRRFCERNIRRDRQDVGITGVLIRPLVPAP